MACPSSDIPRSSSFFAFIHAHARGLLRRGINSLIELVYPKVCLVCRKNLKNISHIDSLVCLGCWKQIKRNLPPFCQCCGRQLLRSQITARICSNCIRTHQHFDRAFSPCVYEGVAKELLHKFKYSARDYLGKTLSRLMIDFIKEYNLPIEEMDCVIPVPLHRAKMREREFNQAYILGKHIAEAFNKELLGGYLLRMRNTKTQTGLAPSKRLENVAGSFRIKDGSAIEGKKILLVDDVLTTGATSSEAALCLKQAGAQVVFVLTLAN